MGCQQRTCCQQAATLALLAALRECLARSGTRLILEKYRFCLLLTVQAVVAGAELAGGAASQLASSPEDSSPVTPTHSATASRQGISAPRARSHHGAQPSVERLSSGTVAIALQALESGACGHGMQAGGPAGAERLVQAT